MSLKKLSDSDVELLIQL